MKKISNLSYLKYFKHLRVNKLYLFYYQQKIISLNKFTASNFLKKRQHVSDQNKICKNLIKYDKEIYLFKKYCFSYY